MNKTQLDALTDRLETIEYLLHLAQAQQAQRPDTDETLARAIGQTAQAMRAIHTATALTDRET